MDGPTPYRAGDRVIIIRSTIKEAGLHNGSVAPVERVNGSVARQARRPQLICDDLRCAVPALSV